MKLTHIEKAHAAFKNSNAKHIAVNNKNNFPNEAPVVSFSITDGVKPGCSLDDVLEFIKTLYRVEKRKFPYTKNKVKDKK